MKVLDQLVAACRTMNFAPATETCYRRSIEDFLRYHRDVARLALATGERAEVP